MERRGSGGVKEAELINSVPDWIGRVMEGGEQPRMTEVLSLVN